MPTLDRAELLKMALELQARARRNVEPVRKRRIYGLWQGEIEINPYNLDTQRLVFHINRLRGILKGIEKELAKQTAEKDVVR